MMLKESGRISLAIQKDGRITDESRVILKNGGFDLEFRSRVLLSKCRNFPLDILSLRDDDIPEYVSDGVSDLGIVGQNVVSEKNADVAVLEKLGFGRCRLSVCAPKAGPIKSIKELQGQRIATSYPFTLKQYLDSKSVSAEIIEISGSVEIAPALNVADAICDLISTGSTAELNGLQELFTVLESEAVLIGNPGSLKSPEKKASIDAFLFRVRSTLKARGKKYLMMNAPAAQVDRIREFVPGMSSPSIVPLATPDMVAIHSVVSEDIIWSVIEELKKLGASDLIVVPIEKMIG